MELDIDLRTWRMVEQFGWTLEYIDSMSMEQYLEYDKYNAVMDGMRKGMSFLRRTQKR